MALIHTADDLDFASDLDNCGACGTAGCRAFAEQLVAGEQQPGKCTVNSVDMNQQIASFLGVDLGQQEKRIARLACAGGSNVADIQINFVHKEKRKKQSHDLAKEVRDMILPVAERHGASVLYRVPGLQEEHIKAALDAGVPWSWSSFGEISTMW